LKFDPNEQSTEFGTIRKGFDVAKEAFTKIDKDGRGKIEFEELKIAFLSMKEDDLIYERLRELDIHGNKSIEFPDFVWGISAWVGMEDEYNDDNISDINLAAHTSRSSNLSGAMITDSNDIEK